MSQERVPTPPLSQFESREDAGCSITQVVRYEPVLVDTPSLCRHHRQSHCAQCAPKKRYEQRLVINLDP